MRSVTPLLVLFGLASCLDFDQFSTETLPAGGGQVGGGGGGTGGDPSGAGGTGGDPTGGQPSAGGAGGGGAATGGGGSGPVTCTDSDTFTGGQQLPWIIDDVLFTANRAELTFTNVNAADMILNVPTVMADCVYQVELVDASVGRVFVGLLGPNSNTDRFSLVLEAGVPSLQSMPGAAPEPEDDTPFTAGVVRIGNEAGTYFIRTAPSASGPWTTRLETSRVPDWLNGPSRFIVGAQFGTGNSKAIADNFNTP